MTNEMKIARRGPRDQAYRGGRFTWVRPFQPKRCPLPPSGRVPVTSVNRGLLRLLRRAELEAWNIHTA